MLNLHLLECTVKGYDHISDLLFAKYWVITGCKYSSCNALTSIYCKSTTPPTLGKSFLSNNNCKIYVPTESVDAYKTADDWKDYADSIEGYNF